MTNLLRSKYIIFENGRPIQLNCAETQAVSAIEKPKRGRLPKSMRVSEGEGQVK